MTENNSTVIETGADPQALSYIPEPKEPAKEAPKPLSAREAIEAAAGQIEKDGGKIGSEEDTVNKEKPADEPKTEDKAARDRSDDGKFARKAEESTPVEQGAEQVGETEQRASEVRDDDKPPARFLPRAKEAWPEANADLKGEIWRMHNEMQKGLDEGAEDRQFRKELRQFEEMTKSANTSIPRVLSEYVEVYNQLRQDTPAAIQRLLATVGVTPQQYAEYVYAQSQQQQQNPQAYQQTAESQRMSQQMQQLTGTVQQMQQMQEQAARQAAIQQVENTLFAEVREQHPRFDELREDVAFFFNSDKLSSIADERSRLFAAVDMAERVNPAPASASQTTTQTRPLNPAGAKSIKGAPNPGFSARKAENLQSREAIEAAMSQLGL